MLNLLVGCMFGNRSVQVIKKALSLPANWRVLINMEVLIKKCMH